MIMLKVQSLVEFWYRYIKEDQVERVLPENNSRKSDLDFTLKREADNIIDFLDLKIINSETGTLYFRVFRKKYPY